MIMEPKFKTDDAVRFDDAFGIVVDSYLSSAHLGCDVVVRWNGGTQTVVPESALVLVGHTSIALEDL